MQTFQGSRKKRMFIENFTTRKCLTYQHSVDVPLPPDHANSSQLVAQKTSTQEYLKGPGLGHEEGPCVHYRLVLETLGLPLNKFKSTRQHREVIRDAIVGT